MSDPGDAAGPRGRTEASDHYLETIYYILHEGEVARPGRIAAWLGVSPPSVSAMLRRLEADGLLETSAAVTLTRAGEARAEDIIRTHRLIERWLTDQLGMDWSSADQEAQKLAGAFSIRVTEQLDEHLGRPTTCPHGNVIPGRQAPYGDLTALTDLTPGRLAWVRRISEVAEHDAPALLLTLGEYGVRPGVRISIGEVAPGAEALAVIVGDQVLALGTNIARFIWVESEP